MTATTAATARGGSTPLPKTANNVTDVTSTEGTVGQLGLGLALDAAAQLAAAAVATEIVPVGLTDITTAVTQGTTGHIIGGGGSDSNTDVHNDGSYSSNNKSMDE